MFHITHLIHYGERIAKEALDEMGDFKRRMLSYWNYQYACDLRLVAKEEETWFALRKLDHAFPKNDCSYQEEITSEMEFELGVEVEADKIPHLKHSFL